MSKVETRIRDLYWPKWASGIITTERESSAHQYKNKWGTILSRLRRNHQTNLTQTQVQPPSILTRIPRANMIHCRERKNKGLSLSNILFLNSNIIWKQPISEIRTSFPFTLIKVYTFLFHIFTKVLFLFLFNSISQGFLRKKKSFPVHCAQYMYIELDLSVTLRPEWLILLVFLLSMYTAYKTTFKILKTN